MAAPPDLPHPLPPPIPPPHPCSRGPNYHAAIVGGLSITITVLSLCVCCLRLHIRCFIVRHLALDDALIAMALVSSICATTAAVLEKQWVGCAVLFLSTPRALKARLVLRLSYIFAMMTVKTSIIASWYFIYPSDGELTRFILATLLILLPIQFISWILPVIFGCSPMSRYWTPGETSNGCINIATNSTANGVLNLATDIAVLAVSIHLARKRIAADHREKGSLICILTLGGLAAVAGAVRVSLLIFHFRSFSHPIGLGQNPLPMMFEINLAMIATSLPMLRPLFRWTAQRFRSNSEVTERDKVEYRMRELRDPNTAPFEMGEYILQPEEPLHINVEYTFAVERASMSETSQRNSYADGESWPENGRPTSMAKSANSRYGFGDVPSTVSNNGMDGPDEWNITLGPFLTDGNTYKDKE